MRQVVDAVCDILAPMTIYLSVFCQDYIGVLYRKSIEIAPQGDQQAKHLDDTPALSEK
ncbi:hypothetical protein [Pseudomonas peradeniyensis]|uniref:hypothetical protein n=1 Tax=Pseudomonas peradeniyensis TaxID=2745488 RepID=UPI001CEC5B24|nr:hypothetical protein [Pseudomonas peradeniyensis]